MNTTDRCGAARPIAAGEAAIGLAIIIVVFRGKISTNVDEMNLLKW